MKEIKGVFFAFLMAVLIVPAALYLVILQKDPGIMPYLVLAVGLSLYVFVPYDARLKEKPGATFHLIVTGTLLVAAAVFIFSLYDFRLILPASLLILAGMSVLWAGLRNAPKPEKTKQPSRKTELIAVGALTIAAFAVRLFAIDKVPLGVWFDEAMNGNEVMQMVKHNTFEVFIPRYTQMPAMFFWLSAPFVKLFGPDINSLRIVSVILGTLCIPAFYLLLRYMLADITLAFAGAALLCFSRWHIMFSRVAFLGMQTIFLEIIFFYFYLRMIREGRLLWAALAGAAGGIALYTFSAANFIPIIAVIHLGIVFMASPKVFLKAHLKNALAAALVAVIVASPLILYASKHFADYSKRMKDVSVMNDVKDKKSLKPVIDNIRVHLLMFHFEGDYNGRHNLYKKPVVEPVTGFLLACGIAALMAGAMHGAPYSASLALIWFFVMLLPGIMTSTVEAPQAYRTSSIIPAVMLICVAGLWALRGALLSAGRKIMHVNVFTWVLIAAIAVMNVYQYFIVYPKDTSAYMDYSPEVNGISRVINSQSADWFFYVSKAENMYGFYMWEQQLMLSFLSAPKHRFAYIEKDIVMDAGVYGGKKGIAFITRPTDTQLKEHLKKLYPDLKAEKYENPKTGEEIFEVYYVDASAFEGVKVISLKGVK